MLNKFLRKDPALQQHESVDPEKVWKDNIVNAVI